MEFEIWNGMGFGMEFGMDLRCMKWDLGWGLPSHLFEWQVYIAQNFGDETRADNKVAEEMGIYFNYDRMSQLI